MKINWFPGHMHKATKSLIELSLKTDIVFEIADARAPFSSSNESLSSIFANKPIIKITKVQNLQMLYNKINLFEERLNSILYVSNITDNNSIKTCIIGDYDTIQDVLNISNISH